MMAKKRISGILKVSAVVLMIILGSAWIGFSINRRFLRGPQKSTYTLKQVDGRSVFVPSDPTPPKTPVIHGRVEINELKTLIADGGVVLVDGRAVKDFLAGHIPGAYSLPALELEAFFPQFATQVGHDQLLAVYCGGQDCSLAHILANSLAEKGFKRLKIYYGGYSDWFLSGNPIEKGSGKDAAKK